MAPAIVSQLAARGKPFSIDFLEWFDVLMMTGQSDGTSWRAMSEYDRGFVQRTTAERDSAVLLALMFSGTLNEIQHSGTLMKRRGSQVACDAMAAPPPAGGTPTASNVAQMFKVMVEELVGAQLEFVLPTSLDDVRALRRDPLVKEFRQFFFPLLTGSALRAGDRVRIRGELRTVASHFRRHPKMKLLSKIGAYVAIPAGLYNPYLGAGVTAAATALNDVAEHWAKHSQWIGLFRG